MKLDASGVNSPNELKGGQRPDPGLHHLIIRQVDEFMKHQNAIGVQYEVLNEGPQHGRTFWQNMWLDDDGNYQKEHLRFALVTGLIRPGETKEHVDWSAAVNAQVVAKVGHRKDKNDPSKVYAGIDNWGMDIWAPNDPEVADVPKNATMLALMDGGGQGQTPTTQGQAQQPAQQSAPKSDGWGF